MRIYGDEFGEPQCVLNKVVTNGRKHEFPPIFGPLPANGVFCFTMVKDKNARHRRQKLNVNHD